MTGLVCLILGHASIGAAHRITTTTVTASGGRRVTITGRCSRCGDTITRRTV